MKLEKGNLFYSATSATSSGGVKGGDAGTSGGIDSDKKMKTNLVKRRFMGLKMPDKQNEKVIF